MIKSCNLGALRTDAEHLMFPALVYFIPETFFYLLLLPCKFIYQQQSFWLICHYVLPVWMVQDVERFPFSCSQREVLSLLSNVELALIGNNKLAHCAWHNLFSI